MDMNERKIALGQNIKRLREQNMISQRSFAQMVGMSQAYLSGVESGQRNIGYANLCKIAEGLDVEPSELLRGIR